MTELWETEWTEEDWRDSSTLRDKQCPHFSEPVPYFKAFCLRKKDHGGHHIYSSETQQTIAEWMPKT